ncbi:MAG TPA: methionyl-tRNA formyltransferase [Candidatus Paceibacterota bacterium]|nr:methionyl-tRNA formyltransferase [Candidatus Paceibacterota bacterium]
METNPNSAKFVYFGTPYVARDTLAILIERGFIPELVVTSPDAPRGRGLTLTPSETRVLAETHGIPVITPENLTPEVVEEITSRGCVAGICVAYGKILPRALIDAFPLGILNIHYSLLPKYRGASPVEGALLHGETVTGVSIQKMVFKMDAGDILAQKEVAIIPTETTRELRPRLVTIGAELLATILPEFFAGAMLSTTQDESKATHSGKIDKSEGELDLDGDQQLNWNKYRAYAEGPGTYFFKDGKRIKIKTAAFNNGKFVPLRVVPEGKNETDWVG